MRGDGAYSGGGCGSRAVARRCSPASASTSACARWPATCKLPTAGPRLHGRRPTGEVALDADQMANAATIAAVGIRRGDARARRRGRAGHRVAGVQAGEPRPAATATRSACSSSGPARAGAPPSRSATRGTPPASSTTRCARCEGWEKMRVTDAAQRVQRSAYPEAYEKWADESDGADQGAARQRHRRGRLHGRRASRRCAGDAATAALSQGLRLDWGTARDRAGRGRRPGGVGRRRTAAGWRYAHWLVSHAADHGVKRVRFGDLRVDRRGRHSGRRPPASRRHPGRRRSLRRQSDPTPTAGRPSIRPPPVDPGDRGV